VGIAIGGVFFIAFVVIIAIYIRRREPLDDDKQSGTKGLIFSLLFFQINMVQIEMLLFISYFIPLSLTLNLLHLNICIYSLYCHLHYI